MISGYDTSLRGEILVSTFTAAMHPINPMAGHILPVIFNGHLGVKFNDVATPARGGFDPDEFWHAWARGRDMTVDIFASEVERLGLDRARPRRTAPRVERDAAREAALILILVWAAISAAERACRAPPDRFARPS